MKIKQITIRFPLYAQIIFWFFLNLMVLGAVFYLFIRIQFRVGLDSLIMGQAGERIQAVSQIITAELNETPVTGWTNLLERFSSAYKIQFFLFGGDGRQLAGVPITLPAQVMDKVAEKKEPLVVSGRGQRTGRGPPSGRGPPAGRGPNRLWEPSTNKMQSAWAGNQPVETPYAASNSKFVLRTDNPIRYWIGARLALTDRNRLQPAPTVLLAMANSIRGSGLFPDFTPWIVVGFSVLLISVLLWLPWVRSVTRSISQMTQAAEQIAEGRFEARVQASRRDELGRLGQAINRLAARLAGYVTGQKRFLGDTAHELCSPIARIQVALGILEQRADEKQKACVEDMREDAQQMSSLVNELLSFSKIGLQQKEIKLEPVNLIAAVRKVLERESAVPNSVTVQIGDSICVLAEPEMLQRALANLIRNAVRYAGNAGPILLSASAIGDRVIITIADSGPGVPTETLEQIFDPFFRVESSRSRDTGGMGLGLAIVKTCVEACQGTVIARNRQPSGLQIDITLKACAA